MIVVIFLPVALLGLLLPINDYEAEGLSGLADCDGPISTMILIGPSLVVYAAGAVYYALVLKGPRRVVLAVLCALMMVAAGAKTWAAYREKSRPEYRSHCEGP
ncbi:MAG TPA: hypothetical protein VLL54_15965 [Pyrinomonadaceae bacterium]|nr:hypothetical protein [Pyrinomonadaceae bacterium]